MNRLFKWLLLFFVATGSFATLSFAQQSNFAVSRAARLCPPDIFELPKDWFKEWVPVGCEVVDCCPGCPGPGPIDWRIRVSGTPIESVSLSFERLTDAQTASLKLQGTAKAVSVGNFQFGKGDGNIAGLPFSAGDRPAVGRLDVAFDKAWQQKRAAEQAAMDKADAAGAADAKDEDKVEIIVEQYLGKVRVNEYRVAYSFAPCGHVPVSDRIVLTNNAGGDSAVVLMDARRSTGCVAEEVRRGAGTIGVGSVLAKNGCRAETVVFSDDDAMRLVENVNAWTNNLGDTHTVDLTPNRLMAPVTVWLARTGAQPTAQADINNANLLYNSNNVGIGFNVTFQNVTANATALSTIGTGCANAGAVLGSAFFNANRLNVYYVNGTFTGINCNASRNIQYIGTTANNQSLAHEFGHSMSLDHTNGLAAFPVTNVMVGGGAGRTHFSEGQAFRMNAHCSSTLNVNGVRTGPVRRCDNTIAGNITCPAATDTHCPALATDVQPK